MSSAKASGRRSVFATGGIAWAHRIRVNAMRAARTARPLLEHPFSQPRRDTGRCPRHRPALLRHWAQSRRHHRPAGVPGSHES